MKRSAQAAVEYLFMLATALIIIYLVIRLVTRVATQAEQLVNESESKVLSELENASQG